MAAIALVILTGFIVTKNQNTAIADIDVSIYRNTEKGFLDRNTILTTINSIDSIKNLSVKDINPRIIERILNKNPYIEEVDCYVTINGKLLINVKEKNPIIRIYNKNGNSIYLDRNGDIIPISNSYTPRVLIASGYILDEVTNFNTNICDTSYNYSTYRNLFQLTKQIKSNKLLSSQINQIYYNSKGEYDLIPELGDHIIKLGKLNDMATKLENLDAFYRKNMVTADWNKYNTINLKYKDQIVCTKK